MYQHFYQADITHTRRTSNVKDGKPEALTYACINMTRRCWNSTYSDSNLVPIVCL